MVLNFCSSSLSTHHFKWFIGRFLICKCFLDFSVEFRFYSKFAHWSDNIFLTIPFLHIIASFANDAVIRHLNEAVASTAKIKYALPHWVVLKGPIKSKPSHFYGLDRDKTIKQNYLFRAVVFYIKKNWKDGQFFFFFITICSESCWNMKEKWIIGRKYSFYEKSWIFLH